MPRYGATRAVNVRKYSNWNFTAADDKAAEAEMLRAHSAGDAAWSELREYRDSSNVEVEETTFDLYRTRENAPPVKVGERIRVPGHFYAADAILFVQRVAEMVIREHSNRATGDPARGVLNRLISEARALCGGGK